MKKTSILLLGLGLLLLPALIDSSDHADPVNLPMSELESGITDLFAFPRGDQLVVMLNVRRALATDKGPFNLEPFEYAIKMDVHSEVTFTNEQHNAIYGGTVVKPEAIKEDVTIKIRLDNDANLNKNFNNGRPVYEGLSNTDKIRVATGVFDDPFIFPRFFNRNTIAMIFSIPLSSFPDKNRQDWIIWGTSTRIKNGVQIDHVGRSNRSQQGRFDFLNTLHPSQHVAAIREHNQKGVRVERTLMQYLPPLVNAYQPLFKIRPYDEFPDVMIYSSGRLKKGKAKFPNGRELEDDVALLTCEQGDCALVEAAVIDDKTWPRATKNDYGKKVFKPEFPYLADKWSAAEIKSNPAVPAGLSGALGALKDTTAFVAESIANCCKEVKRITWATIIVVILIIVVLIWLIVALKRCRRALRPS